MRIDPIEFEIFKNLFVSIAEEMGVTLCRTGFSPNIKERLDYSCAVYDAARRDDRAGRSHARAPRRDAAVGARRDRSRRRWSRATSSMLNDPFRGGTHLPDITLVSPVFLGRERRPSFYVANRAHHSDVGGMSPGSMPLAREIYQEGLIIPPVRLVRRGDIVRDVLALHPRERAHARRARGRPHRADRREPRRRDAPARDRRTLRRAARCTATPRALQDYTERVLRAADPQHPRRRLRVRGRARRRRVRRRRRSRSASRSASTARRRRSISPGRDPQADGGVNANFAITLSASLYAFRCLVDDDVLYNAGVVAPARR